MAHTTVQVESPARLPGSSAGGKSLAKAVTSVTRQAAAVVLGKGAFFLIGLGINVLLARMLGAAALGQYQLGLVVAQLASSFCVLGQDKGLMRYLPVLEARCPEAKRTLFIRSLSFVLLASCVFSAVLYYGAPFLANHYFHSASMVTALRAYAFYLPILAMVTLSAAGVIALKRADYASSITNMLWPAANLALLAAVAFLGGQLVSVVWVRTLSHALALGFLVAFLLRQLPKRSAASPESQRFAEFLRFSSPLWLIGLSYYLIGQLDIIILGYFVDEEKVGVYSVAVRLSALVAVGIEVVLPILAPLFSQLHEEKDLPALRGLFGSVTKWIFYGALAASAFLMVFRVELLRLLFGPGFTAGAPLILILCLGQLFRSLGGPTGQVLIMTGRQKWEIANTAVLLIVNLALNLLLVRRYGILGAAIATASTITVMSLVKAVQVYCIYKFHAFTPGHLKGVLAIGAGCVLAFYLRLWLVSAGFGAMAIVGIAGTVLVLVVCAALWLLGFDPEDRMALSALRLRRKGRAAPSEPEI